MRGMAILLLGVVALATVEAEAAEDKYGVAVIIGNRTYAKGIPAVEYAHRDAEAMLRFVKDGLGYRGENIIELRDATVGQMLNAFGNEGDSRGQVWQYVVPGKSDVIVYYSGHGVPDTQDKRGYLLPVDANPDVPRIGAYPLDRLYANLARVPSRSTLVILDACFSGETPKGMIIKAASGISVTPHLPEMPQAFTVLAAASGDQFASWDEQAGHGLFTEYLLRGLYGEAVEKGRVTVGGLRTWLTEGVGNAARRTFRRVQTPDIQGQDDRVVVAWPGGKAPARPKLAEAGMARTAMVVAPSRPGLVVEPLDATYVALKRTTLRSDPDTGSSELGRLEVDSAIAVTGRSGDGKWIRGVLNGQPVWMLANLVKEIAAGEMDAWKGIKGSKDADAFADFLRRYPEGYFAPRARERLAVLRPSAGDKFRDCEGARIATAGKSLPDVFCGPEMVVIPDGSFQMGSSEKERTWYLKMGGTKEGADWETPRHEVAITRPFIVSVHEVTRGEYARFVKETGRKMEKGCYTFHLDESKNVWEWGLDESKDWRDPGFKQTDDHPVVCVSWNDATAYGEWMSRKTGQPYRLLSEAEWEYAARANGTEMRYWGNDWENKEGCRYANVSDLDDAKSRNIKEDKNNIFMCKDGYPFTAPVGKFRENAFKLKDMLGNAWEWVADCWNADYNNGPDDEKEMTTGDCTLRVLRGGSWGYFPGFLRAAFRVRSAPGNRDLNTGFRLARTL